MSKLRIVYWFCSGFHVKFMIWFWCIWFLQIYRPLEIIWIRYVAWSDSVSSQVRQTFWNHIRWKIRIISGVYSTHCSNQHNFMKIYSGIVIVINGLQQHVVSILAWGKKIMFETCIHITISLNDTIDGYHKDVWNTDSIGIIASHVVIKKISCIKNKKNMWISLVFTTYFFALLWRHLVSRNLVNGLRLLPEPLLICHYWGYVAVAWSHDSNFKVNTWDLGILFKYTYLKLRPYCSGANELRCINGLYGSSP